MEVCRIVFDFNHRRLLVMCLHSPRLPGRMLQSSFFQKFPRSPSPARVLLPRAMNLCKCSQPSPPGPDPCPLKDSCRRDILRVQSSCKGYNASCLWLAHWLCLLALLRQRFLSASGHSLFAAAPNLSSPGLKLCIQTAHEQLSIQELSHWFLNTF